MTSESNTDTELSEVDGTQVKFDRALSFLKSRRDETAQLEQVLIVAIGAFVFTCFFLLPAIYTAVGEGILVLFIIFALVVYSVEILLLQRHVRINKFTHEYIGKGGDHDQAIELLREDLARMKTLILGGLAAFVVTLLFSVVMLIIALGEDGIVMLSILYLVGLAILLVGWYLKLEEINSLEQSIYFDNQLEEV